MAHTAHKTEEEKLEYFDTEAELDKKVEILAQMVLQSKHFIAFTGAGISTSTGIPDFRSGINTVLPTGPGAWEKLATKKDIQGKHRVSMLQAIPSVTHMGFVELEKKGYLKFLISQNVDGLHRRSGFAPQKLAEVHGNTNLEKCLKCKKQYLRDFKVRTAQKVHDHQTGRKCDCGGVLVDSIINFGENLPEWELNEGFRQSELADLCLCMGSSLRVTPAADMPATVGKRKKNLVIVNIQKTPLDGIASLVIHALTDKVMTKLFEKLKLQIPEFKLHRYMQILKDKTSLNVKGVDVDGCPYSIFKSVAMHMGKNNESEKTKEPIQFLLQKNIEKGAVTFLLKFHGHYGEPPLAIDSKLEDFEQGKAQNYHLTYTPKLGKWEVNLQQK